MGLHRIKKGLDLPISGAPRQEIELGRPVSQVAILGSDFIGMKPRMAVNVGDVVKRGQLLFEDRKAPGVRHTAPGAGVVTAVHRGAKRAFESVVIELTESERDGTPTADDFQPFESYTGKSVDSLTGEQVKDLMVESGLWTSFRERPYSRVPSPDSTPRSIFVTAIDTSPLAANVEVCIGERHNHFEDGVKALRKLFDGTIYICRAPGTPVYGSDIKGVQVHDFAGPHPAGLVGTHIHTLDPVYRQKTVWHLNYADLLAIGELFETGVVPVERIVALAGPVVGDPRLLRTRTGASLRELLVGEVSAGHNRILSGSVLSGTLTDGEAFGFLGRYATQITALAEGGNREFLGWLKPGLKKWSVVPTYWSALFRIKQTYDMDTDTNGSARAMVPLGLYENVFPLDILPTFLLRSLISGDLEKAEQLGVLELDEEDVALCSVVCPGKVDYGPILRNVLNTIHAEG